MKPLRVAVTGYVYCACVTEQDVVVFSSAASGIGLEAVKSGGLGDIQYR